MAHRLQLVAKHSMKKFDQYKKVEKLLEAVYNFYNKHGHKQKQHIRTLADVMEVRFYEFHNRHGIRWLTADYRAVQAILRNWKLLIEDIDSIAVDPDFSDIVKAKAIGIRSTITGKNFLAILHFTQDILTEMQQWTLKFQQRAATLIGLEEYRENMIKAIEQYKTSNGPYLSGFLVKGKLNIPMIQIRKPAYTLQQYYSAQNVIFNDIELTNDMGKVDQINDFRENFIQNIIDQLNSYFPEGRLTAFDILLPKKWPIDKASLTTYGQAEIQSLAQKFMHWMPTTTQAIDIGIQWKNLLQKIADKPGFCESKLAEPNIFWKKYLADTTVHWGTELKELIRIALVLPIGSADAERGFSQLKILRNSRPLLESDTLDHLLRVRINGPSDLEKFPALTYAKKWVDSIGIRTDDPIQKSKKRPRPPSETATEEPPAEVAEDEPVVQLPQDTQVIYLSEPNIF